MKGAQHVPAPFVKSADSNFLLFGYSGPLKEYFLEYYDDEELYGKQKDHLESIMRLSMPDPDDSDLNWD
jgi:hypothetical protein